MRQAAPLPPPFESLPAVRALRTWLDAKWGRATALAETLGVPRQHLAMAKAGTRRLPKRLRRRVEKLTGGYVRADAWLTRDERRRALLSPTGSSD